MKTPLTVLWRSVRLRSLERCTVKRSTGGWEFSGSVLLDSKRDPAFVSYRILTSRRFVARRVWVRKFTRRGEVRAGIEHRGGGWLVDGRRRPDLRGCTDIDLEFTPLTNSLAIRRRRLKAGRWTRLTAAWVRLGTLGVSALEQSYRRVGAKEYVYRSATGFTARLELGEFGLVKKYGRIWEAVS